MIRDQSKGMTEGNNQEEASPVDSTRMTDQVNHTEMTDNRLETKLKYLSKTKEENLHQVIFNQTSFGSVTKDYLDSTSI